jgi:tetratricopeptide (TPR) repeat protein
MFSSTLLICQPDQEKFLKANELYNESKYQEALDLYNSMAVKGCSQFYNIGNCYFKLNNSAKAIGNWKKALKLASFDQYSNIEFNIEQGYKKLNKNISNGFVDDIYNILAKYVSFVSLNDLILIFLLFWFVLVLFYKKLKSFRLLLIIIVLFNFLLLNGIFFKYYLQAKKTAFVIEQTKIFAGPEKNYHTIGVYNLADELKIKKQNGDWYLVSMNNSVGWVNKDSVIIV